jgi:hypothetical protein
MQAENRIALIINAYFNLPRGEYAQLVTEVRINGGLTPAEVRTLKDRLAFIHSDTIIRQAGLSEPGKMQVSIP